MRCSTRLRRLAKWTGTLICLLIALAGIACLRWSYLSVNRSRQDGTQQILGIGGGALGVLCLRPANANGGVADQKTDYYELQRGPLLSWQDLGDFWKHGVWPRLRSLKSAGGYDFRLPLWIPFFLIGVPTIALWRLDRRRFRPGHCPKCGYNLTGNVTGICSECGAATECKI